MKHICPICGKAKKVVRLVSTFSYEEMKFVLHKSCDECSEKEVMPHAR